MSLFFTVALVQIVALMSPGPDFFFVSRTAVSRSRYDAMLGVLGVTFGGMIWAAVALLGLHLILQQVSWLQLLIVLCSGGYLCWMGLQMLRSAFSPAPIVESVTSVVRHKNAFLHGLLTNLSNPKALIYFGSVFSLFVGDSVGSHARIGIFTLVALETLIWFTLVAFIFALPFIRNGYLRLSRWIDGIARLLFVGFGLCLLFLN